MCVDKGKHVCTERDDCGRALSIKCRLSSKTGGRRVPPRSTPKYPLSGTLSPLQHHSKRQNAYKSTDAITIPLKYPAQQFYA